MALFYEAFRWHKTLFCAITRTCDRAWWISATHRACTATLEVAQLSLTSDATSRPKRIRSGQFKPIISRFKPRLADGSPSFSSSAVARYCIYAHMPAYERTHKLTGRLMHGCPRMWSIVAGGNGNMRLCNRRSGPKCPTALWRCYTGPAITPAKYPVGSSNVNGNRSHAVPIRVRFDSECFTYIEVRVSSMQITFSSILRHVLMLLLAK